MKALGLGGLGRIPALHASKWRGIVVEETKIRLGFLEHLAILMDKVKVLRFEKFGLSDHGLNMRFRAVDVCRNWLQDLLPLMTQEHSDVDCAH